VGSEQRQFAQSALGRYLPPEIARAIIKDPDRLKLTGERRTIHALFSDIEGFTTLTHAIEPERTAALMDGVQMRENPAEWAFVRLSKLIEDFEKGLDKDDEIGARIVGLPGDGIMSIEDLGFWGPDFIMFLGRNSDGKPVRLIQHYNQINVLLDARRKPEEREARRIGFQLSEMVGKTNPK
jgi:class 3 adenylate cyclase